MINGFAPGLSARRDRLSARLAEMARRLEDPSPTTIRLVRDELARLAQG